jgi:hypothetical protein
MKVGGALTMFGGSLLTVLGPLAAITGVIYGSVKAFQYFNDQWNGATAEVATGEKLLASAAKNAARELSEIRIPESFKKNIEEENEATAVKFSNRLRTRGIEGNKDEALRGQTDGLIRSFIKSGQKTPALEALFKIAEDKAGTTSVGGQASLDRTEAVYDSSKLGEVVTIKKNDFSIEIIKELRRALSAGSKKDTSSFQKQFVSFLERNEKEKDFLTKLGQLREDEKTGPTLNAPKDRQGKFIAGDRTDLDNKRKRIIDIGVNQFNNTYNYGVTLSFTF